MFDDPNLVSCAGLEPVSRLAERVGLGALAERRLTVPGDAGAHAGAKVTSIVGGMLAGADSIDDLDILRHGGMGALFAGLRAPSTLGTFLRGFTFGHVRQLESASRAVLARLARAAPLLPGVGEIAFVDIDSTISEVFGHAKQGAGYGYTKVNGLHPLLATVSTPLAAPVICGTRLRRGSAHAARGGASFVAETLAAAHEAGATGTVIARMDAAFYAGAVVSACRAAGARFSITVRMNPALRAAIAQVDEQAWVPIRYPDAVWDEQAGCWISEAEIAETTYTAFAGTRHETTARLVVRRVQDRNHQDPLFPVWRYHAFLTDSPLELAQAEARHRGHAVVEQVIADLKNSAAAHLPSGIFAANGAWLALAGVAFNLTRAAGALASTFHARARTGTIRAQLIAVPARIARSARRLTLHLPEHWPWAHPWQQLFRATRALPGPT